MICLEKKLNSHSNIDMGALILRLSLAILMLFHGLKKASSGIDGIVHLVTQAGLPEALAYGVYVGEILFPLFIILGLFTRASAVGVALTMLFAIFLAYGEKLFVLGKTGGPLMELPLFYLLVSLAIVFIGAGKYSLDNKLKINTKCQL